MSFLVSLGWMMDESTSRSTEKSCIVYVRYLDTLILSQRDISVHLCLDCRGLYQNSSRPIRINLSSGTILT